MAVKNQLITALMVLLVMGLGGCAKPLPEPVKPTDCEADCIRNCLTERDCCVKACNWIMQKDQPDCRDDCTRELEQCYKKCQAETAAE